MTTQESATDAGSGNLLPRPGLTVRTLHYYEQIGLLVASERSDAGHRLYAEADVERLYRICLLRRFGLPLGEIARALDDPAWSLHAAMATHLHDVERRIDVAARLRGRLAHLVASTGATDGALTDDLLEVLEEMTMLDATVQRRISILVYADLEAAYTFLVEVFGLGPGELTRDEAGVVHHVELEAGDGVVWLHPESKEFGLASPARWGPRPRRWR